MKLVPRPKTWVAASVICVVMALMAVLLPSGARAQSGEAQGVDAQNIDEAIPAVIGGALADPGEHPYLVAAHPNGCGGTLIAPNWVLTATVCAFRSENGVLVPRLPNQIAFGHDHDRPVQVIDVKRIVLHPEFDPNDGFFDRASSIALYELAAPANLTHPEIDVITLNADPNVPSPGTLATALGFGFVDIDGENGISLNRAAKVDDVPVQVTCLPPLRDPHRFCTDNVHIGGHCADVGSPLIIEGPDGPRLIGMSEGQVTINGRLCEPINSGQVYQRISFFEPWIRSVLGNDIEVCGDRAVDFFVTPGVPFVGTDGDDVVMGTELDDIIDTGAGDDVICSGAGRDKIRTGPGDDLVYAGPGIDRIWGYFGRDTIYGEGGSDRIWAGPGDDLVFAGSGADRVWGGSGNDELRGMGGKDSMWGQAGNDELQGNFQSDLLAGGDGNDVLRGSGGKDIIYGGPGDDMLFGGANTDFLDGQGGTDIADGQAGKDNPFVPGVSGCSAEQLISC